jgi:hypothetical protein
MAVPAAAGIEMCCGHVRHQMTIFVGSGSSAPMLLTCWRASVHEAIMKMMTRRPR